MGKDSKTCTIASNGYVLIYVGKGHHLADVRGYAYEHRLVAEEAIGRRLGPGEEVHHKDGDKRNNAPENLQVMKSKAEHFLQHRKHQNGRKLPNEENVIIECACGCGYALPKFDEYGRPRKFLSGHNPQASPTMSAITTSLTFGPLSRQQLSDRTGISVLSIATALSKMKRTGHVEQIRHGVWRLKDGR